MAYDITNPDKILFANYINSRDFSKDIAGDVSPEGLCMISASESADGNAYLLASCEVSGTVAAYKLISQILILRMTITQIIITIIISITTEVVTAAPIRKI